MPDPKPDPRRDSVSMVGPYARIRIIAAIVVALLAFVVIGIRAFSG